MKSLFDQFVNLFVWICFFVFFVWSIGAIYYNPLIPQSLTTWLAAIFAIAVAAFLYFVKPIAKARAFAIASFALIFVLSLIEQPRSDRNWASDQSKAANVSIENGIVKIKNFRHCVYRSESDFDPLFYDIDFPLEAIQSVWFIVQKFTAAEGVAHVFLSFELSLGIDPHYFCVSVEIRREQGETYDPIRGMYRNYELAHIIGDEQDMIGVRTVHRPNDRVHMYHVNATPKEAQSLFLEFAHRIESLNEHPQFYNSLLNNCANGITGLTYKLTPEPINWLDSRIVLPGYSAHFAFENGLIGGKNAGQSFDELQKKSRIDSLARENGINKSFSTAIRSRWSDVD